jgi:Protein of unknown function (DUF1524)/Excalibur calcium-binding domain
MPASGPAADAPADAGGSSVATEAVPGDAVPTDAVLSDPVPSDPVLDPAGSAEPGTASAALAELAVKGRAPRTGYERDLFGSGWGDPDRNGCDTRNDVLARDLTGETFKPGTRDCVVAAGTLADPYSGATIEFRRGQDTSDDVQIDHVVAVSDAWQKGAQAWDDGTRVAFYNDPLNLLAVDGPLNQQKGDGDAATWLPPDGSFRCSYVARQIAVKSSYRLWVTAAERDAMARVLERCPGQLLPDGPSSSVPETSSPMPRPSRTSTAPGVRYDNCAAVRAAGAAPIRRGEPGYDTHLDGDGDGVGCE